MWRRIVSVMIGLLSNQTSQFHCLSAGLSSGVRQGKWACRHGGADDHRGDALPVDLEAVEDLGEVLDRGGVNLQQETDLSRDAVILDN